MQPCIVDKYPASQDLPDNFQHRIFVLRLEKFSFQNWLRTKIIDIFSSNTYNNNTRQATACVCQSVEVRGCAGRHCLTELSGGVVQ